MATRKPEKTARDYALEMASFFQMFDIRPLEYDFEVNSEREKDNDAYIDALENMFAIWLAANDG